MELDKMNFRTISEKTQEVIISGRILPDSMNDDEEKRNILTIKQILESLKGYPIIEATAILRKCENALQQAVFDDEIK